MVEWAGSQAGARSLYFPGEPFRGQPTRVFAQYAVPVGASPAQPVPAVLLLHDIEQGAFADWAAYWADRGYAALAVDLFGNGPQGRLPDGGPASNLAPEPDPTTHWIFSITNAPLGDVWSYHAVAAAVRGVSVLGSFSEVDPARIGVHGVGLGGHLACTLAGIDDRIRAAAPVYGSGLLHENSSWHEEFRLLPCAARELWVRNFDPARYLPQVTVPIVFVTGANDPQFPLDAWQDSWNRIPGFGQLALLPGLVHGPVWRIPGAGTPAEVSLDAALRGMAPLPQIQIVTRQGRQIRARFQSSLPLAFAYLAYTFDTGAWQSRVWNEVPVVITGDEIAAEIPEGPTVTHFLYLADTRTAWASSPVEVFHEPAAPPFVVFDTITRTLEGGWRVAGRKPEGAEVAIEASQDFCTWLVVAENRAVGNAFEVELAPTSLQAGSAFLRARRLDF